MTEFYSKIDAGYVRMLQGLGIEDIISINAAQSEEFIVRDMPALVFNSNSLDSAESTGINEVEASIILNKILVPTQHGEFKDYIELINHSDLYRFLPQLSDRNISVDDVIGMRKILFREVLGIKEGLRERARRMLPVIIPRYEDIRERLQAILNPLNHAPNSLSEALLKVIEFHANFIELHPFEDGNGRTSRALMSLYLLKSGARPILFYKDERQAYRDAISMYAATGAYEPLMWVLTYMSCKSDSDLLYRKANDYFHKSGGGQQAKILFGMLSKNPSYYDTHEISTYVLSVLGGHGNIPDKILALYIAGMAKLNLTSDKGISDNSDYRIRAAFIIYVGMLGGAVFKDRIQYLALNDESPHVRGIALAVLGKIIGLDDNIITHLLDNEEDHMVMAQLSRAISWSNISNVDRYASRLLESKSDVARQMTNEMIFGSGLKDLVLGVLNSSDGNHIDQYSMRLLAKSGMLQDADICKWFIREATKDKMVKNLLLSILTELKSYDPSYDNFLKNILLSDTQDFTCKDYAAYLVGREEGSSYLDEKYGYTFHSENRRAQNLAVFLSYLHATRIDDDIAFMLRNDKMSRIKLASAEKIVKQNTIGKNFLLEYQKHLKRWAG